MVDYIDYNIEAVYNDIKERLQTKEDKFYVSLNDKQELNVFADFYKRHVDFRKHFLKFYFDGNESLPVYMKFHILDSPSMSHQNIYGDEFERNSLQEEYKEWINNSTSFTEILNPDLYPEYFI